MMEFVDILKELAHGEMPKVKYKDQIGKVVVIKDNGRHKGVGVDFGKGYDEFFHADNTTDKRSRYIYELTLA